MASKMCIRGLKLRGFKSFRGAEVSFPDGYVCITGPNGTGKSNIADAVRFALGESSLKALRTKKVSDLINTTCKFAEVTLSIQGKHRFEITRAINREGKTLYRLNGKRSTHTMVMEELRPYGLESGTSLVNQGGVQEIVEMPPMERIKLIENTADLAEFDEKKGEARCELEKIDMKISEAMIILGEREAIFNELKKEKEEAISYLSAQDTYKRAKASIAIVEFSRLNEALAITREQQSAVKKIWKNRRAAMEIEVRRRTIEARIADVKEDLKFYKNMPTIDGSRVELEKRVRESQSVLEAIKSVNLKAPELYEKKAKDLSEIMTRISSLEMEKKAILDMVDETNAKRRAIFLSTFSSISKNFKVLCGYAGLDAELIQAQVRLFDKGVSMRLDGKPFDSLSGWERSLLALILLLSMRMEKGAPFCVLDEADAALDRVNSKRLSVLLKKLSKNMQLIVITRNDAMLSGADAVLNVTKIDDSSGIGGKRW